MRKISINNIKIINKLFSEKQIATLQEELSKHLWDKDENGNPGFNVSNLKNETESYFDVYKMYINNISVLKSEIEKDFKCTLSIENHNSIVEYRNGWSLHPHCDSWSNLKTYCGYPSRDISSLIYFTDDFSGGDLIFPELGISIEPAAGMAIYFPSDDFHMHEVTKVISGKRWVSTCFWYIMNRQDSNKEI